MKVKWLRSCVSTQIEPRAAWLVAASFGARERFAQSFTCKLYHLALVWKHSLTLKGAAERSSGLVEAIRYDRSVSRTGDWVEWAFKNGKWENKKNWCTTNHSDRNYCRINESNNSMALETLGKLSSYKNELYLEERELPTKWWVANRTQWNRSIRRTKVGIVLENK